MDLHPDDPAFDPESQQRYDRRRLFRALNLSLAFVLPAWAVLSLFNANVAGLFAGGMVLGYLLYEIFHACEHLPARHPLTRLPWLRQMRHLHALHHRRDLMQARNFNIVLPLTDWLCGTLHHEPEPFRPAAGETRER